MFDERIDPGRIASFVLAAAMHLALFAVLVFGVSWQNRPPEAVQVELWSEPAPAPVETKLAPVPEPVAAKPKPVIAKPEIALREPDKLKPAVKPVPKPEAARSFRTPMEGDDKVAMAADGEIQGPFALRRDHAW